MSRDNTTTLVGNLTRDPDLRFTNSGMAVAGGGLAVNRSWVDKVTQERKEEPSFFNLVFWGQLGENVAASLSKGDRVVVTGEIRTRSYTPEGEDKPRYVTEIVVDEIGPSLRWATASVEKNARTNGASAPHPADEYADQGDPFAEPAPA